MKAKTVKHAILAGLILWAIGITTVQASSTFITFSVDESSNLANGTFNPPPPAGTGTDQVFARGTFNGWGAYLPLVQMSNTTVWTNTVEDTVDPNGGSLSYIFHDTQNGDEGPADWANRTAYLPTNSGASLVLPTPYFNDKGPATSANIKFQVDMSEELELGHFNPKSGDTVVIAGSFNGWNINAGSPWILTNDPTILVTNYNFPNFPEGLVESNVYTATVPVTLNARYAGMATPNCAEDFKYVEMPGGNWDGPGYPNSDSGGNRFFTEYSQTLPLVNFNDVPYTPLCQVNLNLDMTGVTEFDPYFVPGSVSVWGTFNSWATGIPLTNNPAGPNTNFYTGSFSIGQNAQYIFQYRYTNSLVGGWVYDFSSDQVYNNATGRRTISVPTGVTSTNLPITYFLDLAPNDYLPQDTPVLFSVDMNGAVDTNGYMFNPATDDVYINGMFANGGGKFYPQTWYAWSGGIDPVTAPAGYQMIRQGTSTIYTNTIIMPRGMTVGLQYQYGMDPGRVNGGPLEDEAPSGYNHIRVVRTTALSVYNMPVDTFTNAPYQEPVFAPGNLYEAIGTLGGGNLTIGPPAVGSVPVSWLGRPGAHLQVKTNLGSGTWQDLAVTDGTNWTNGRATANGLMSVTNWHGASNSFFRLVKP